MRKMMAVLLWLVLAGVSIDLVTDGPDDLAPVEVSATDGGGDIPPPSPHP